MTDLVGTALDIAPEEFRGRAARLQEAIAERGLPGAIVVSRGASTAEWAVDVLYLTNHFTHFCLIPDLPPRWAGHGYSAVVVPAEGPTTLIVDNPDYRPDLVVADEIRVAANLWAAIPDVMREKGLTSGQVGLIGEQTFTLRGNRVLADALPDVELVFADKLLEDIRRIKSRAEIARLRNAAAVGSKMMNAYLEAAVPGVTEAHCLAAAHSVGLPLGASPWDTPTGSGPWASYYLYHRNPAWDHTRPLEAGDLIHPDLFGTVYDYQYDFSRTAVVGGKATPGQRHVMEAAMGVVEHVSGLLRAGAVVKDVFASGREWLDENGPQQPSGDGAADFFDDLFPSFGHGLGQTWERPYLMADEDMVLQEGMVFAVETQVSGGEHGAAGFEHNVVVTAGEPEVLSRPARGVWWD
jgi:Xaa-Pro aminopeptidase